MTKNKGELILPEDYSTQLAEETGIHIGDGSVLEKIWVLH